MFRKSARAVVTASIEAANPCLVKKARVAQSQSLYDAGVPKQIDVRAAVNLVADIYGLSKNPDDYIYVVARAVTAELPGKPNPNENGDAFTREELLRFDHRLARRVYKTFDYKPNHVNHRCFVEGTPVVLADGTSKPIESVKVGDRVLDRNGRAQPVESVWCEGVPDVLLRVAVKGYGDFFCTSQHQFPVWAWPRLCACGCGEDVKPGRAYRRDHYRGGPAVSSLKDVDGSSGRQAGMRRIPEDYQAYQRLEAGQIRKGDYLLVPVQRPDRDVTGPTEKARLLGYYIAEGCSSYKGTRWTFGSHEVATWVVDVERICADLGVTTRRDLDLEHGTCVVRTIGAASHDLQNWLREHGGQHAAEKRLSSVMMAWSLDSKRELIRGMFRGDGSQHYRNAAHKTGRTYRQFIVAYTTVSAALASQVRMLLAELGLASTLEVTPARPNELPKYILRLHGQRARDLAKLVWDEAALGQELVDSNAANRTKREGEFLLVPVKSVEMVVNIRPVYNLTVSGDHSYLVGGGLATFNSDNPKTARGFILDSSYNSVDPDDQFVECLIAIDAKKDPTFAEGIRTGAIDSFSMGCVAEYTICSVCGNRATNRWQFCRDIAGHKMKMVAGKLAYEKCGGVCFEELSAVDQPADPRAIMQEILAIQARLDDNKDLQAESEILTLKSRLAKLEAGLKQHEEREMADTTDRKTAQMAPPPSAPPPASPPAPAPAPVVARDEEDEQEMIPFAGQDELENYKQEEEAQEQVPSTDDEIGLMNATARKLNPRFVDRYSSLVVLATRAGNFKLRDQRTGKDLFAIRPPVKIANRKKATQFCEVVLCHVAHFGLRAAMERLHAIPYPKTAQVLDEAEDNLTDKYESQQPAGDDADDNLEEPRGKGSTDSTADHDTDREDGWSAGPSSSIDDRETNAEDADKVGPTALGSTDSPDSDKREDPDEYNVGDGDGTLTDEIHDHDGRVGRVIAFYQRKIAAQDKAFADKMAALETRADKLADQKAKQMLAKFERCLRIASERQRVNREVSPIKIAMAEALLQPFDINDQERFAGIETDLTGLLVERGMQDGIREHLASLLVRAKELYAMDDRVLADSEKDLKHAMTTPVTAGPDSRSHRSSEVEERALAGNPVFKTSANFEGAVPDKNARVRASLNVLSSAQRARAYKGANGDVD